MKISKIKQETPVLLGFFTYLDLDIKKLNSFISRGLIDFYCYQVLLTVWNFISTSVLVLKLQMVQWLGPSDTYTASLLAGRTCKPDTNELFFTSLNFLKIKQFIPIILIFKSWHFLK